ncbi:hypothetical protein EPA93_36775 [Ktedonosporobacter rubrisoli]|uniref:Uncharacterized protein n=1 Tax=Ktedonosporobacter rubrisoli TaxID=2509675 RepID=A0A4P6JZI8_KTERU|nr:hypothetical protein [Ktedonosporobacter rubrisoli]QBD81237.1 hypothetical protein EPA93_36775 [Ktedonosporobacter rubrisoli]
MKIFSRFFVLCALLICLSAAFLLGLTALSSATNTAGPFTANQYNDLSRANVSTTGHPSGTLIARGQSEAQTLSWVWD